MPHFRLWTCATSHHGRPPCVACFSLGRSQFAAAACSSLPCAKPTLTPPLRESTLATESSRDRAARGKRRNKPVGFEFPVLQQIRAGLNGYLIQLAGDAREQDRQEFSRLSSGWAIGSAGWRQALARAHTHRALERGIARSELREIKETRWRNALDRALEASGKPPGRRFEGCKRRTLENQDRTASPTSVRRAPPLDRGVPEYGNA